MTPSRAVPHFVLYEEQGQDAELLALHVEPIHSRSSRHDWTIRPHAHPDHHQILMLAAGGGTLWLEETARDLAPGMVVTVPATAVHAYRFQPGTDGFVATIAPAFLAAAIAEDDALQAPFAGGGACHALGEAAPAAAARFAELQREFAWSAPARRSALRAHLQLLLVALARLPARGEGQGDLRRREAEIVARYRQQIERRFRAQPDLPDFAQAIGVTTARLNAACRAVTGRSAMALVHERLVTEAKRDLLYTGRAVAQIARDLGFADPAYFNRFFRRHARTTPGAFRREMGTIARPAPPRSISSQET
jgi:AraC family transcriptional activator of pobA